MSSVTAAVHSDNRGAYRIKGAQGECSWLECDDVDYRTRHHALGSRNNAAPCKYM